MWLRATQTLPTTVGSQLRRQQTLMTPSLRQLQKLMMLLRVLARVLLGSTLRASALWKVEGKGGVEAGTRKLSLRA
jgi:hypothetical protein